MPTIHLHYDGWLTLPAHVRHHLGIATGDQLQLELIDDALVLRRSTSPKTAQATIEPGASVAVPAAPTELAPPKRGPGRPRKLAITLAPHIKVGGRRKMPTEK